MIPTPRPAFPRLLSAMEKAIRRGLEREAMEFAVELMHTSKAFHSMVCNRLEVIICFAMCRSACSVMF
jgi:hypothetical protein